MRARPALRPGTERRHCRLAGSLRRHGAPCIHESPHYLHSKAHLSCTPDIHSRYVRHTLDLSIPVAAPLHLDNSRLNRMHVRCSTRLLRVRRVTREATHTIRACTHACRCNTARHGLIHCRDAHIMLHRPHPFATIYSGLRSLLCDARAPCNQAFITTRDNVSESARQ